MTEREQLDRINSADEYGRSGARPYEYHKNNDASWFIGWFISPDTARELCPDGWTVSNWATREIL